MPSSLSIVYFAHSLRSDWNNGNAHFLRGLLRSLAKLGHTVRVFEPAHNWSLNNLETEPAAARSLSGFTRTYPEIDLQTYTEADPESLWRDRLADVDIVVLHEWNPPALARHLLVLRDHLRFKLLFHDTHHRASSSPAQIAEFGLERFDGVLAFGESLRAVYRTRFHLEKVWTLHEAADTTVFKPPPPEPARQDLVWIGNWGEGERAAELREFLLEPAGHLRAAMRPPLQCLVYGVRYPPAGLSALAHAGIRYGGYLPNLEAPAAYAQARLTLHVPRQHYTEVMRGIPTIRVFEALACGIPLISAPWQDSENLFRPGDFRCVPDRAGMTDAILDLLHDPAQAAAQASRGLETILARHTCDHRAQHLSAICEDLLQ